MSMAKFFRIPFATSGDKVAVPDASQPSGSVSYTDGFGPDYELDPGVDPAAKDVPRDETNQLYFDITNAIKEYQEFGVPDFITSALNGGTPFTYARYARVKWTDGKVYESTTNGNTSDPSNTTNWRVLTDNADYLTIATTAFQASVTDGEAVYWDGTQFDEAIADGTDKQNVIGFADVTNGRVFVAGLYAGQLSGLTANTVYYLSGSSAGAMTTVLTAVRMGTARTATSFFVDIGSGGVQATETVAGIAEVATQAEVTAGTDGSRFVTPLKLRNGFAISLTTNGYIKLPSWLGGLIIQWALSTTAVNGNSNVTVTFPMAFPTAVLGLAAILRTSAATVIGSYDTPTASNFIFRNTQSGNNSAGYSYIAIGY